MLLAGIAVLVFVAVVATLYMLRQDRGPTVASAPEQALQSTWAQFINYHTSGQVSRTSNVQIRFLVDVATPDQVGKSAAKALTMEPGLPGEAVFSSQQEITFTPAEPIPPETVYTFKLNPAGLESIPDTTAKYEFQISAIKQAFTLETHALQTDGNASDVMQLVGSIKTADIADGPAVETMLRAEFEGADKQIQWEHSEDRLRHKFTIAGLERGEAARKLTLKWNGKSIDVDDEGSREVEIPAIGKFGLLGVRAEHGEKQTVIVEFSDPIDTGQNLSGLLELEGHKSSSRVVGNAVHIYPAEPISGQLKVIINPGIRNMEKRKLGERYERVVFFSSHKPQVQFTGQGVILPANKVLSIPFQTMNVRKVQVTAFRIFDNNIGQFFQTNKLSGDSELLRVGRYLWRKTISIPNPEVDNWARYELDASELLKKYPKGLFRLTLSINRGDSIISCSADENAVPYKKEEPPANQEDEHTTDSSGWDFADTYYSEDSEDNWKDRENPCKDAYYSNHENAKSSRNFMASNIGIIAKRGVDNEVNLVATHLDSSLPAGGVDITFYNFQDQKVGQVSTDSRGFARITTNGRPFYLVAQKGGEVAYLKLSSGNALATSHFDVGGEDVSSGAKGYIYGERGVWRPGDDIHLTFVLHDRDNRIPDDHPATMYLINPKGQMVQTVVNTQPMGGFYVFNMRTAEDAVTGNWTARAVVGGGSYSRSIKIETVKPNRLKLELTFPEEQLLASDMPAKGKLFAQWLHGAVAANLKADVKVRLRPVNTSFTTFSDFIFDDPVREYEGEEQTLAETTLDGSGNREVSLDIKADKDQIPGRMKANFELRVFEPGGDFSISNSSINFEVFDHYVGVKAPKGDATRNMLLTDTKHKVEIASVDSLGKPVSLSNVKVDVYKLDWKWWWDKSGESLASFAQADYHNALQSDEISTHDGRGTFEFEIKYPDWGRYLVRACDTDGGHCSGQIVYVDWPGWAGRAQEQSGSGASALTIYSDKKEYSLGEEAVIRLPEASKGRALLSVETGTRVLSQQWVEFDGKGMPSVKVPITAAMAPTAYVSITLVQPHKERDNDRPMRLFGVTPLAVTDPATHLTPQIEAADEWQPLKSATVKISEKQGREMVYTLAMVDEGLLGLTSYKTPDLHAQFYKKEKLGVSTWDLFDEVAGAYSGELQRLLALGGGADEIDAKNARKERRFPPVVKFMGPFRLAPKQVATHQIELPQYLGAVRLMVVAGEQGSYGSAEKSVYVREALSMVATIPRVLGPGETATLPVNVFVQDPNINDVSIKVETLQTLDNGPVQLTFDKPGDKLGFITLKVADRLGKGHVKLTASSGKHQTVTEVDLNIRSANPQTTEVTRVVVEPGKEWHDDIVPHGLEGTNHISLEASVLPPINLERRLQYLIQYPHGCLEQTTSSAFPQLYLHKLLKLDDQRKQEVDRNVQAAITRLRSFQLANGAFSYWPGQRDINEWASDYAGHFLVEAQKAGYQVPADMIQSWLKSQTKLARDWTTGQAEARQTQAYRLYTLALVGQAEVGAMNRLRETQGLDNVTLWQLAAAYALSGMNDVAAEITRGRDLSVGKYEYSGDTFGSELRDRAIILDSLAVQNRHGEAGDLSRQIAEELGSKDWLSTQSIAYSLSALARFAGASNAGDSFKFAFWRGEKGSRQNIESSAPYYSTELKPFAQGGENVSVSNAGNANLFVTITSSGVPKAGAETAANNVLSLKVDYLDADGNTVSVDKLPQGKDVFAHITVKNTSEIEIKNIALTHITPSGWEIHNDRMGSDDGEVANAPYEYQDIRDDRVLTYFGLKPGQSKTFKVRITATYPGKYYLPGIQAEAMYDADKFARSQGRWVEVLGK